MSRQRQHAQKYTKTTMSLKPILFLSVIKNNQGLGFRKVWSSKGYLFKVWKLCCRSMSFHRNRIFNAIYAYRQFGSISYLLFRKTKNHKTLNNKRKNEFQKRIFKRVYEFA